MNEHRWRLTLLPALLALILTSVLGARQAEETRAEEASQESEKWDVGTSLGDGYDISIDTTEGTWINLDVSPDGEHIVFDLLGDLYQMPISGGDAEALTSGPVWDMQPRYSRMVSRSPLPATGAAATTSG